MRRVMCSHAVPKVSRIALGFGRVDYVDAFHVRGQSNAPMDVLAADMMTPPRWVLGLLRLRDALVRPLGLRTGASGGNASGEQPAAKGGLRTFPVRERTEDEIIMEVDDSHLRFRVSVLREAEKERISTITVVQFHNTLGRVYFFFVRVFHMWIVRTLMRNLARRIEAHAAGPALPGDDGRGSR